MGYCHSCGTYVNLTAAAMCAACRDSWLPAVAARPGDLGCHAQPQPLGAP
jgi:hypothetical protein